MLFITFCTCFLLFLGYVIFYIQVDRGKVFKQKSHLERKENSECNSRAKNICGNICAIMMILLLLFTIFFLIYSLANRTEYYNLYSKIFCVISIFAIIDIICIFFYITTNQEGGNIVFLSLVIICLMLCPLLFNSTLSYEKNTFGAEELLCIDEENNIYVQISETANNQYVMISYKAKENGKDIIRNITAKKANITLEKSEKNNITGYYDFPVKMNIFGKKYVKTSKDGKDKYAIAVKSYDSIYNIEVLLN